MHLRSGLFIRSFLALLAIQLLILIPVQVSAASTNANSPSSAADGGVAYSGVASPWNSISNANTSNGQNASALMHGDGTSNFLIMTGYGFNLPSGAFITGIEVSVEGGGDTTGMVSGEVQLYWDGGGQGTSLGISSLNAGAGTYTLGGSEELWGTSWGDITESVVENGGFGVSLVFYNLDMAGGYYNIDHTAFVDNVKIKVYYAGVPTVTLAAHQGECTGDACPQLAGDCGYGIANANGTYPATITFSESVTGFAEGDISLTNGSIVPGSLSPSSGPASSYTATITSSCTDCLIQMSVGDNVVDGGNVGAGPLYIPWGENYWKFCDLSGMFGLHWKLDEASGTTAADDLFHGDFDPVPGTLMSFAVPSSWRQCAATTAAGNLGSLRFDGYNDYIKATLNVYSNPSIVALWAKASAEYPTAQTLLQLHDGRGNSIVTIMYRPDKNHYLHVSTPTDAAISSIPITLTQWNHILVEVDNGNINALWVNGTNALAGGDTTHITGGSQSGMPVPNVFVGTRLADFGTHADYFTGLIDDVWLLNVGQYDDVADAYAMTGGTRNLSCPADATPPTASAFTPADNATNVSTTTDLVIRFNQTVTKGVGNIVLKKADDTTVQTIDVTTGNVTLSTTTLTNDTATIAINDLTASTSYYVTVAEGSFKDSGGTMDFAGITDSTNWNFQTVEAGGPGAGSAPVISALTPADDASNISTTTDLVLRFDQAVSKGAGNIVIKKTSDDSIVQTVDVASADATLSTTVSANDTATISIDDLDPDTGYYVTMAEGTFSNPEGTLPFAGISDEVTWNFQTTDVPLFRIRTLPTTTPGATYGVRSRSNDADVHGNGMPSGSYTVRLTSNNVPVADVTVSLSEDREWNEVVAATDPLWYRGVISFQGTDTGVSGTHTLYVPKGPSTTFRVCPEAVTLSEVSDTCTNGVAFTGPYPQTQAVGSDTVIVGTTDVGGTTYWYASGLSGSGGEGEDDDGNTIPFFPVWSIPIIGVIGWYVLKKEGWVGV